jgi:hypothetical protein
MPSTFRVQTPSRGGCLAEIGSEESNRPCMKHSPGTPALIGINARRIDRARFHRPAWEDAQRLTDK